MKLTTILHPILIIGIICLVGFVCYLHMVNELDTTELNKIKSFGWPPDAINPLVEIILILTASAIITLALLVTKKEKNEEKEKT